MFADLQVRLCILDIKDKTHQVLCAQLQSGLGKLFWQVEPFLMMSWQVILMGEYNAILEPDIDCSGER